MLGQHRVAVTAREQKGLKSVLWLAPKKYANSSTSGLTVEITGPRDDLEINLKWEGGTPFLEQFQ